MKNKFFIIPLVLFVQTAWAGDGIKTIDLNFNGTVVQPSCTITFSDGSTTNHIDFGSVSVSDIRYFEAGQVDNPYTSSKTIDSPVFGLKIKDCTPANISADSQGKQFTLSIAAGAGSEWVSGTGNYMGGGLSPTSGATDFAAKVMVPATFPAEALPTQWKALTATGITGKSYPSHEGNMGTISDLPVAFSDLITSGSGSTQSWELPMKVTLGMESVGDGRNTGVFNVSAIMTVAYY